MIQKKVKYFSQQMAEVVSLLATYLADSDLRRGVHLYAELGDKRRRDNVILALKLSSSVHMNLLTKVTPL